MATIELKVQIDLHDDSELSERDAEKLAEAVYQAIDYALDNDIAGAECLNLQNVGQVSVTPL